MGKKGNTKYSGKFKNGDKFGKYTIIDENVVINREAQVLCQCECKDIRYVSCWTLLMGKSKGCLKCNNPRPKSENPSWRGCENISGKYYSSTKRAAHKRGIEFNVTIEYFNDLIKQQNFKCKLSGLDISFSSSKKDNYVATASIDRINSDFGYVVGNLQWVHKDVNLMKNYFNQDYFIYMCETIINENKNKNKNE